jgi:hypothetical protein
MLNTFEHGSTGALLRCHLAMDAKLTRSDHGTGTDADAAQVEDWFAALRGSPVDSFPAFKSAAKISRCTASPKTPR